MTDQPEIGDFGGDIARSVSRHLATYVAGFLVSVGAISHDQATQVGTLLASLTLYGAAQGWSVIEKYRARRGSRF